MLKTPAALVKINGKIRRRENAVRTQLVIIGENSNEDKDRAGTLPDTHSMQTVPGTHLANLALTP